MLEKDEECFLRIGGRETDRNPAACVLKRCGFSSSRTARKRFAFPSVALRSIRPYHVAVTFRLLIKAYGNEKHGTLAGGNRNDEKRPRLVVNALAPVATALAVSSSRLLEQLTICLNTGLAFSGGFTTLLLLLLVMTLLL